MRDEIPKLFVPASAIVSELDDRGNGPRCTGAQHEEMCREIGSCEQSLQPLPRRGMRVVQGSVARAVGRPKVGREAVVAVASGGSRR